MNSGLFYSESCDVVAQRLGSDQISGLDEALVEERLTEFGPNALQRVGERSWFGVLLGQFFDFLIVILLIAAFASLVIGQTGDALTILAVVILNGCLGFVQEWRAERSLEALQSMLAQKCLVIREGHEQVIDARQLVPGDLVRLTIGDCVPADIRLIECTNLRVDESALTGESMPVQ